MRNIQILGTLICCLYSLMFIPNQAFSQLQSSNGALEVIVDESSNAYFSVNFDKGATLYSICKEYHIATIDAMMLNEIVNPDQISIGEKLILPLNREFFRVKKPAGEGFIPVYYRVKKQETLFRISKVYFAQDVKDMIERNQLSGFTLAIDEKLLVGYYQVNSAINSESTHLADSQAKEQVAHKTEEYVLVDSHVVKETRTSSLPNEIEETTKEVNLNHTDAQATIQTEAIQNKEQINNLPPVATYRFKPSTKATFKKVIGSDKIDHSVSKNKYEQIRSEDPQLDNESIVSDTAVDSIQSELVEEKPVSNLTSRSQKGIAYWDKKGKDYENLMVLHKSAEVNTLIKLTNPVNGMSTFARVVGKIPENAFKKDIDVVLSPAVARKIGAIDARMQIAMTYQIIKP